MRLRLPASAALALLSLAWGRAEAAYVTIDDRNPDSVTLTAGGFQSFSVDAGNGPQMLADNARITLADGLIVDAVGVWTRSSDFASQTLAGYFAPGGGTQPIASGVQAMISTRGTLSDGTLELTFTGFAWGATYFTAATSPQGSSYTDSVAGLTVTFLSEPIPEPASAALLGLGLLGLGTLRRSRRAG